MAIMTSDSKISKTHYTVVYIICMHKYAIVYIHLGIALQSPMTRELTKVREVLLQYEVSHMTNAPVAMAISLLATVRRWVWQLTL